MADENIVRSYRSSGPARRATETVAPRDSARDAAAREESYSDPLAELARLIGQSDPFADLRQTAGRGGEAAPAAPRRPDPAPASGWRATAAALAREAMRRPAPAEPRAEEADPHLEKIHSAIADIDSYRGGPNDHFAQNLRLPGVDEHAPEPYGEQPYFGDCAESLPVQPHAAPGEEANYFFNGESESDERFYDDITARRGNGLLTVAVLIGCALLGTVGAYGYRTYYSGARSTDTPIISADPTPNKMVPAAAAVGPQSGKTGQVGDASTGEQVVTHQEEPMALPSPNAPAVASAPQAPASTKPSAPGAAAAGKDPGQPKKVRTLAIRPDNPDEVARPQLAAPASPPGQTATPPATTRTPASAKPASQSRNGSAQGEQPGASRLASLPPAAAGSYVVQLSSQRSEADAQASSRSLQAKFPQLMGDREPFVRRADLGAKGIYYRSLVGPFGSAGEADQFCSNLKAAGGQCIVQKN